MRNQPYVDDIDILQFNNYMTLGRFGGNSSDGQYKNEDGCLIWADRAANWEFVIILDAHNTSQSAEVCSDEVVLFIFPPLSFSSILHAAKHKRRCPFTKGHLLLVGAYIQCFGEALLLAIALNSFGVKLPAFCVPLTLARRSIASL